MAIHNVFVDTGAWYALFDKQDNNHNRAKEFYKTNTSPLFTSNFVVDETLTLLKNRKGFSFTDCTSFALMEKLRITTAFAFDVHYRQYGKFLIIP